jgi:hypothetical protein
VRIAKTDRGQLRTGLFELICVIAQLRDMMPAEDSPVVAKEDDDGRTFRPERSESNRTFFGIRQREVGERRGEGITHLGSLSIWIIRGKAGVLRRQRGQVPE